MRMDESLLLATPLQIVDVTTPQSVIEGIGGGKIALSQELREWSSSLMIYLQWQKGTNSTRFEMSGTRYLRIIYGPEYTLEDNFKRLRSVNLMLNVHWLYGNLP